MISINKKLGITFVSAGFLCLLSVGQIKASTDITVSGNGYKSDNNIKIVNSCSSTVYQNNDTSVINDIVSLANTGNVTADKNTGGEVSVQTGDAVSVVTVNVVGGNNQADNLGCCECKSESVAVDVKSNGSKSETDVIIKNKTLVKSSQKSGTSVLTSVYSKAKTGKVKAKSNTGSGVEVKTGDSASSVEITVEGGANVTP